MLKKIVVTSLVAALTLLTMACGTDVEDACEHLNEICASQAGFTKIDCAKAQADYDKQNDAEKEADDKVAECVDDADTCEAAIKCGAS